MRSLVCLASFLATSFGGVSFPNCFVSEGDLIDVVDGSSSYVDITIETGGPQFQFVSLEVQDTPVTTIEGLTVVRTIDQARFNRLEPGFTYNTDTFFTIEFNFDCYPLSDCFLASQGAGTADVEITILNLDTNLEETCNIPLQGILNRVVCTPSTALHYDDASNFFEFEVRLLDATNFSLPAGGGAGSGGSSSGNPDFTETITQPILRTFLSPDQQYPSGQIIRYEFEYDCDPVFACINAGVQPQTYTQTYNIILDDGEQASCDIDFRGVLQSEPPRFECFVDFSTAVDPIDGQVTSSYVDVQLDETAGPFQLLGIVNVDGTPIPPGFGIFRTFEITDTAWEIGEYYRGPYIFEFEYEFGCTDLEICLENEVGTGFERFQVQFLDIGRDEVRTCDFQVEGSQSALICTPAQVIDFADDMTTVVDITLTTIGADEFEYTSRGRRGGRGRRRRRGGCNPIIGFDEDIFFREDRINGTEGEVFPSGSIQGTTFFNYTCDPTPLCQFYGDSLGPRWFEGTTFERLVNGFSETCTVRYRGSFDEPLPEPTPEPVEATDPPELSEFQQCGEDYKECLIPCEDERCWSAKRCIQACEKTLDRCNSGAQRKCRGRGRNRKVRKESSSKSSKASQSNSNSNSRLI